MTDFRTKAQFLEGFQVLMSDSRSGLASFNMVKVPIPKTKGKFIVLQPSLVK